MPYDATKISAVQRYLEAQLPASQVTNQESFDTTAQVFTVRHDGNHTHHVVIAKSGFERYSAVELIGLLGGQPINRLKHPEPTLEVRISDHGLQLL